MDGGRENLPCSSCAAGDLRQLHTHSFSFIMHKSRYCFPYINAAWPYSNKLEFGICSFHDCVHFFILEKKEALYESHPTTRLEILI